MKLEANQVSLPADPPSLDLLNMAQAQQDDIKVQAHRTAITTLILAYLPIPGIHTTLLGDISNGVPRPIVPQTWRHTVFNALHGLAHPGIKATRELMAVRYVWHGINNDVGLWAKACIPCQKAKVQRHVTSPLLHGKLPDRRFKNFTSTFLDHFQGHRAKRIFSPSSTTSHGDQKPFPWLMLQEPHALEPYF